MSMFGVRPGWWWFTSKKDPRWNVQGRSEAIMVTGGRPREANEKLEELKKLYGDPPDDLEYECMKD